MRGRPSAQAASATGPLTYPPVPSTTSGFSAATTWIACTNPTRLLASAAGQRHQARRGSPRVRMVRRRKPAAGTTWASSPRVPPTNTTSLPRRVRVRCSATAIPG